MSSKEFVILDLDNCISDDRNRIASIDWSKKNPDERYADYHAACGSDRFDGHTIMKSIIMSRACVVIFTARPISFIETTHNWLVKNGVPYECIFMRDEGDHRHSVQIKEDFLKQAIHNFELNPKKTLAFDDRQDVLTMYSKYGVKTVRKIIHSLDAYTPPPKKQIVETTAADVLHEMSITYKQRNSVYGNNYKMVGRLMAILFPSGVQPELVVQEHFHLFELILVKISRYAVSGLKHKDSIHDAAVYAAMCEASNENEREN